MVKSDCEQMQNLIPLYIDNMLSEEENDILCEHIKNCRECQETYELLKSVILTAKAVPEISVPEDFHEKLMGNVRKEAAKKRVNLMAFRRTVVGFAAAAAVVAFSVIAHVNLPENTITQNPEDFVATPAPAVETKVPEEPEPEIPEAEVTQAPIVAPSVKPEVRKDVKPVKTQSPVVSAEVSPGVAEEPADVPAPASLEDENVPSVFSLRDNDEGSVSRMSDYHIINISVDESEYEKAKEILSGLETDETGYKLPEDSSQILNELSELSGFSQSAEVSETADNDYIVLN